MTPSVEGTPGVIPRKRRGTYPMGNDVYSHASPPTSWRKTAFWP